jgi:hypothetical protein
MTSCVRRKKMGKDKECDVHLLEKVGDHWRCERCGKIIAPCGKIIAPKDIARKIMPR